MAARKNKYFRKEDVNVKFPDPTGTIQAQRGNIPYPATIAKAPGKFKPIRILMNLKIVDVNQPNVELLTFMPPVELHVRYTEDDQAKAGGNVLCLGYWSELKGIWIPLTKPENHSQVGPLDPEKKKGLIKVYVPKWGDPPIAIGT